MTLGRGFESVASPFYKALSAATLLAFIDPLSWMLQVVRSMPSFSFSLYSLNCFEGKEGAPRLGCHNTYISKWLLIFIKG